jgi:hypothetical protein
MAVARGRYQANIEPSFHMSVNSFLSVFGCILSCIALSRVLQLRSPMKKVEWRMGPHVGPHDRNQH